MLRHYRAAHDVNVEPFECPGCDFLTLERWQLDRHVRAVHLRGYAPILVSVHEHFENSHFKQYLFSVRAALQGPAYRVDMKANVCVSSGPVPAVVEVLPTRVSAVSHLIYR